MDINRLSEGYPLSNHVCPSVKAWLFIIVLDIQKSAACLDIQNSAEFLDTHKLLWMPIKMKLWISKY